MEPELSYQNRLVHLMSQIFRMLKQQNNLWARPKATLCLAKELFTKNKKADIL